MLTISRKWEEYQWEKTKQIPGYTFFIGYKEKRPACILYPSVSMREGRPEAVILIEGDENLLSIMQRYFQKQREQAKLSKTVSKSH
jgi:hypothetical protein